MAWSATPFVSSISHPCWRTLGPHDGGFTCNSRGQSPAAIGLPSLTTGRTARTAYSIWSTHDPYPTISAFSTYGQTSPVVGEIGIGFQETPYINSLTIDDLYLGNIHQT